MARSKRINIIRHENETLRKGLSEAELKLRKMEAALLRFRTDRDYKFSDETRSYLKKAAYQEKERTNRRKLLTVDGPNGAGKSTLLRDLGSAFTSADFRYAIIKESSLCTLLEDARRTSKQHEGYDGIRDREQTIGSVVTAGRLIEGRGKLLARLSNTDEGMLILDRYIWTTIAFQLGTGRSIEETIGMVYNSFIHPDASIILTCDPEVARRRAEKRYLSTPSALDTGKQMEVFKELKEKNKSYEDFVRWMGNGYNGFTFKHYDTTEMQPADVALAVIKDVMGQYTDNPTMEKMEEHIRNKYKSSAAEESR